MDLAQAATRVLSDLTSRWGVVVLLLFELGDAVLGCGELVFQADDADGRSERHVLVEQGAYPLSEAEFGSAVAALAPGGAIGGQQSGGIEATQERRLHAEQVSGKAHGVGREILVVQFGVDAPRVAHLASGDVQEPWLRDSQPGPG